MNGRFSKLEVGQRADTHAPAGTVAGTPVRTPSHDMALADEAYRTGSFEQALQLYTRALRDDRSLIRAWVGQVHMLIELAEYDEARLWTDKSLELFKSSGELLAAKARACLRQGDRPAATAASDASLQCPGSSAARWQARAEVLLSRSPDRARDCFERSFTEPGADWFERVVVARAYLFHHVAASAITYAQAAVQLQPSSSYAWLVLGRCQQALGWSPQARESYSRSIQLPGDRSVALAAIAALDQRSPPARLLGWVRGLFAR